MRTKKTYLDIDIIGEGNALTPEEEKALSEFFQKKKLTKKRHVEKKIST